MDKIELKNSSFPMIISVFIETKSVRKYILFDNRIKSFLIYYNFDCRYTKFKNFEIYMNMHVRVQ